MPRLHLVIVRPSRNGEPTVVYCGPDGTAAQLALATAPQPFAEYFRNPRGIRKHVPGAAANAAAEEAAFATETAAAQEEYNAAVLAKAEELAARLRVDHAAIVEQLRAEAASALAAADKAHRDALAAAEQAHAAELAKRDAEVKALDAALKAAKKSAAKAE